MLPLLDLLLLFSVVLGGLLVLLFNWRDSGQQLQAKEVSKQFALCCVHLCMYIVSSYYDHIIVGLAKYLWCHEVTLV